jgi:streptogramin lyase
MVTLLAAAAAAIAVAPQQQIRTERMRLRDTSVVRTPGAPPSAGVRMLQTVLSFGAVDGSDAYNFGVISDLAHAPDGSIWLYDSQSRSLKKFDSTGRYIRNVGRNGEGPNEYGYINGMTILRDGTAYVWDGPKWRMLVFTAAGEPVTTWNIPRGPEAMSYATSASLYRDTADNLYAKVPIQSNTPMRAAFGTTSSRTVLVKLSRDGRALDTLAVPTYGVVPPRVDRAVAAPGGRTSRASIMIPFSAIESWAWSPFGYFVSSPGDRYAVHLSPAPGRPMRIEREVPAVPITAAQRSDAIEQVEERIQRLDPGWRWANPEIPRNKYPVNALLVDEDGRIWVSVAVPSERIADAEFYAPPRPTVARSGGSAGGFTSPGGHFEGSRFRAPVVYDVYSPDGRFLGRVPIPRNVTPRTMYGNFMWAVTRDSLDVQHVTKFRFAPPLGR